MRLSKKFMHALSLCLALALIVGVVGVTPASAGKAGGYVVATGTPEEVAEVKESYTGAFLREVLG